VTGTEEAVAVPSPAFTRLPPPGRRVAMLLGALAAGWVVPFATHLLGVDWLVLLAIGAGGAGLLRGGRTVLDRFVLAATLLVGTTLVAGLVFSVWPWHLHPVALGGSGLTVLIVASAALRRPWRLPRWVLADTLVAVPVALLALAMCWPYARRDLADRLALMLAGEDGTRHFVMFDTLRRVGGYLFLHRPEAIGSSLRVDLTYPPGSHMLAAVFDGFVTSSAQVGDAAAAQERFLWYQVAAYVFLGLTVIWSARRVAGPVANAVTFAPVAGAAVGYLLFGDMITAFLYGYLPEILGLGYLAVLIGIAARPLARTREQVAVMTAAVVAIGFTYYVALPIAAAVTLAYAWSYRRRLLRRPWLTATAVALGTPLTLLVLYVNSADQSSELLVQRFGILPVRFGPVLALGLLVVTALAARSWRRSAATRTIAVTVATAGAVTVVIGLIQIQVVGHTVYFFHKFMHSVVVVLLIALGATAAALARGLDAGRGRVTTAVMAAGLTLVPIAALGGFSLNHEVRRGGSWGIAYLRGTESETRSARTAIQAFRHAPPEPGRQVMVFFPDGRPDVHASMSLAALRRVYGPNWPTFQWLKLDYTPAGLSGYVLAHPAPGFQVITANPHLLQSLRELRAGHPELQLSIVDVGTLPYP
jgi:hypothetical protein